MGEVKCISCDSLHPAGEGSICKSCYHLNLLSRRVDISVQGLKTKEFHEYFRGFSSWLGEKSGAHSAARKLDLYLELFAFIEERWAEIPSFQVLFDYLKLDGYKKYKHAILWMESAEYIKVDNSILNDSKEAKRISDQLSSFKEGERECEIIRSYALELHERREEKGSSLLSIRLALTPAIALLSLARRLKLDVTQQQVLDSYLLLKPGQRASIHAFVRFVNSHFGVRLVLPTARALSLKCKGFSELEQKIVSLLDSYKQGNQPVHEWVEVCLKYFHGVALGENLKYILDHDIKEEGFNIQVDANSYWIPSQELLILEK